MWDWNGWPHDVQDTRGFVRDWTRRKMERLPEVGDVVTGREEPEAVIG